MDPHPAPPEFPGLDVLLAEEAVGEGWLLAEVLRSRGHSVTLCEDAATALDGFGRGRFSLVILDRLLPGADCAELCRKIRAMPSGNSTVLVVVTTDRDPAALEDVLQADANDYILKPVDVGSLHMRLAVAEQKVRKMMQRQAIEEALAAANTELKRANEELEAFAWSISHDLRAPLRTMQGFAHTLLKDYGAQLDERGRDYAERIIASGTRSEVLIRDLLAYSRISFESIEVRPVELQAVAEAAMELLEADLRAAGVRIVVENELPRVLGSHTILQQVLTNLISNAMKFVPKGRKPEVRLWTTEGGDHVRLFVQDNGKGIPAGQEERIFRTFERLSESQEQPGTGIGLAIVRRGMERLAGAAGVEPAPESGSRFWVDIPRA